MPVAQFNFAGDVFAISYANKTLLTPFHKALAAFAVSTDAPTTVSCTVSHGQPLLPASHDQLLYAGPLPFSNAYCVYNGSGGHYFLVVPGQVSVEIKFREQSIQLIAVPNVEDSTFATVVMLVIEAALSMTSQYLVHGAALASPDNSFGFLLFAPSGAGKTTTSLALVHQSFKLLSDDTGVIVSRAKGFELWGLPRSPKIHHNTVEILHWLKPYVSNRWDCNGEQLLSIESLSGLSIGHLVPLNAIVRLRSRISGSTRIKSANKVDLMIALAADNLRRGASGIPDYQLKRFEFLSQVANSLPTFDLRVGDDLSLAGPKIMAALRGA